MREVFRQEVWSEPPQGDWMPPSTELKCDISVDLNHYRWVDRRVVHGLGR
jgi:hypothetical protein